jgi:glycosyltransferase involved in cell wall biosynthesis
VRICLIGKFPPIQGGVSMRTYWAAHALAARGHDIQVVTNAKEVQPPFRMHMRPQDWERCEARYGEGAVTVHWTDPVDRSQAHIPLASPFVSKLAGIALRLHTAQPFDVIFSFYLEPYGVAGHLVSQATGVPHVVRMAGSDAGLLWHHPQLEALYDQVLRSAAYVITGKVVAARAVQRGVNADRVAFAGGVVVPEDVFSSVGPCLDLATLRREVASDPDLRDLMWGEFAGDRPYFGIYGKLGVSKGTFALLAALRRLKDTGADIGLVLLAHGPPAVEERFRTQAREFGLTSRILQLPFLPHWRVPEFIRGCLAMCCLEQDFPIPFHSPIVPREALLCGACVVAATEVIRKLPNSDRLPHRFGCVAIEDVNDIDLLSRHLAAIVADPAPALQLGARGREFALAMQRDVPFPQNLENVLMAAAGRAGPLETQAAGRVAASNVTAEAQTRFRLCRLAAEALAHRDRAAGMARSVSSPDTPDLPWARGLLAALRQRMADGDSGLTGSLAAVGAEIAVAAAEDDADATGPDLQAAEAVDPLFRLRISRWALATEDLARLTCVRDPRLRLLAFHFDVVALTTVRNPDDLAIPPARRRGYLVAFGRAPGGDRARRAPLAVDAATARLLELSDGNRTAAAIAAELCGDDLLPDSGIALERIAALFAHGLILLEELPSLAVALRAV